MAGQAEPAQQRPRSARDRPNRVMAACAQAATALSASPSGEAAGAGAADRQPPAKPSWCIASWRIASAAERAGAASRARSRPDAQPGADPPVARPGQRHRGRGADDLDRVGPPRRAPRRQQHGSAGKAAAGPLRRSRAVRRPAGGPPAPGRIPTASAARHGRTGRPAPARQVCGRGGGIGAQQHGRPSRSRQPRSPGQDHARQGQLVLQPARSGRGPQPGPPHPPGNDIMTTSWPRPWSRDRHRAAPCSPCRRARKRTPAASPGPACSCRTTPTLFQVLRRTARNTLGSDEAGHGYRPIASFTQRATSV